MNKTIYLILFTLLLQLNVIGQAELNTAPLSTLLDSIKTERTKLSNSFFDFLFNRTSPKKGQLNMTFSLPWVNAFYFQPEAEPLKSKIGFMGISAGLEYYYKQKRHVAITANGVIDFKIPVPAPIDRSGEYEEMTAFFFTLTNNIRWKDFTIGHGVSYSKNTWHWRYSDRFDPPPPTREPITKTNTSLGLTLNSYYQLSEYFSIGIIYVPSLLTFPPETGFRYEHLISLDLGWQIRLKK